MPAVRGLAVFISDIRNCKCKEAEIKRINKELANVRSTFKGDRTMDIRRKIHYSIKDDLSSRSPVHVNLALQCIANIGSREMAETFGSVIPKLLVSGETIDSVKQTAALCLLRLLCTMPEIIPTGDWPTKIFHHHDQHMGVVTSAVGLIDAFVKKKSQEYICCVSNPNIKSEN